METERVKPFVSFVKKQRGAGFKKIPANWADFLQKPDWAMEGAAYSQCVADLSCMCTVEITLRTEEPLFNQRAVLL